MPVRSSRIFGPQLLGSAAAAIYTVPTGRTLVVRQIAMVNSHSAAVDLFLYINGSGLGNRYRRIPALAAGTSLAIDSWMALNPEDVLWANASVANVVAMSGFGALLLGEPE